MAGTLDGSSSRVKREIKVVDISGKTPAQIEAAFNNNYGKIGWRIIQIVVIGGNPYLLAEREV